MVDESYIEQIVQRYINHCRYEKGLDSKTLKAYRTDISSIVTTQIYTHVTSKKQRDILTAKHPRNKNHY